MKQDLIFIAVTVKPQKLKCDSSRLSNERTYSKLSEITPLKSADAFARCNGTKTFRYLREIVANSLTARR